MGRYFYTLTDQWQNPWLTAKEPLGSTESRLKTTLIHNHNHNKMW